MDPSAMISVTPLRRLGLATFLAMAIGLPGALPAVAGIPTGTTTELETSVPLDA